MVINTYYNCKKFCICDEDQNCYQLLSQDWQARIEFIPYCDNQTCYMYAKVDEYGPYGPLITLNGTKFGGLSNNISWTFRDNRKLIRAYSVSCNGCVDIQNVKCSGETEVEPNKTISRYFFKG